MSAEKALLSVREVVELFGDQKAVSSFYIEFRRRLEALKLVEAYCNPGSMVLDIGVQLSIISCVLRKMGCDVIAFDVYAEPYKCTTLVVLLAGERGERLPRTKVLFILGFIKRLLGWPSNRCYIKGNFKAMLI